MYWLAAFSCIAALSLFARPAVSQSENEVEHGEAARKIRNYTDLTDEYGRCLSDRVRLGTGIELADLVIDAAIEKCRPIYARLEASIFAKEFMDKMQAKISNRQRQEANQYMAMVMANPVFVRHAAIQSVVEYQFKLKAGGFTATNTARSK